MGQQNTKKIYVKDAIGELYIFEKQKKNDFILNSKPDTEYRKYLRSSNNKVNNHEIVYPAANKK